MVSEIDNLCFDFGDSGCDKEWRLVALVGCGV